MSNSDKPLVLGCSEGLGPTPRTDADALPALPTPWDYCYLWNGPYGARKFTAAHHNGRACDNQVMVFTADQMRAYATQAKETARAAIYSAEAAQLTAPLHAEIARLRAALREIGDAAGSPSCQHLDKPTDFAIAQDRGMQLSWIVRATNAALGPNVELSGHQRPARKDEDGTD